MEFWRIHNKRLSENKIDWADFVLSHCDWVEFADNIKDESEEKNAANDK